MIRHLNKDISFCELDGRLFFLDVQRDRYFQLSRALEHSFLSHLNAPDDANLDASGLLRLNLLTQASTARADKPAETGIAHPSQSVLETLCLNGHVSARVIRDVFINVFVMRWQLRTRRLKSILLGLNEYRRAHVSSAASAGPEYRQHLREAATTFHRIRPYVPVETCCLIDSLSMIRFLAKQGLHSHLVIGIACDPFSAHAWVQHGPMVLNETVGTAQAHVPIRVV